MATRVKLHSDVKNRKSGDFHNAEDDEAAYLLVTGKASAPGYSGDTNKNMGPLKADDQTDKANREAAPLSYWAQIAAGLGLAATVDPDPVIVNPNLRPNVEKTNTRTGVATPEDAEPVV